MLRLCARESQPAKARYDDLPRLSLLSAGGRGTGHWRAWSPQSKMFIEVWVGASEISNSYAAQGMSEYTERRRICRCRQMQPGYRLRLGQQ